MSSSIVTPELPAEEAQHAATYKTAAETGEVHPSVLSAEAQSQHLAEARTHAQPSEKDYSDSHVHLSAAAGTLTVKHWLITHPTLVIPVEKIVWLRPAPQIAHGAGVHPWGPGITGIAWARDLHRLWSKGEHFERSWVCKYEDAYLGCRVGFTTDDPEGFQRRMEQVLPGVTHRAIETVFEKEDRERTGYKSYA